MNYCYLFKLIEGQVLEFKLSNKPRTIAAPTYYDSYKGKNNNVLYKDYYSSEDLSVKQIPIFDNIVYVLERVEMSQLIMYYYTFFLANKQ